MFLWIIWIIPAIKRLKINVKYSLTHSFYLLPSIICLFFSVRLYRSLDLLAHRTLNEMWSIWFLIVQGKMRVSESESIYEGFLHVYVCSRSSLILSLFCSPPLSLLLSLSLTHIRTHTRTRTREASRIVGRKQYISKFRTYLLFLL